MSKANQSKRQREDDHYAQCEEDSKRHKPYNQILSILEEDEVEPNQDMLDIFQSLEQELSSNSSSVDPLQAAASAAEPDHQSGVSAASESSSPSSIKEDDEEQDDGVRMMRHLLEASDDELGLPSRSESGDEEIYSGENTALFLGDGLWEFEDDAANYYTMLQSELFM